MKSRSLIWGCMCGVGGGAALSLVGLLLLTSNATNDSPSIIESEPSETASTDHQPLDLSNLEEFVDKTKLPYHRIGLIATMESATFDQILELFNQTVDQPVSHQNWFVQETLFEQLARIDPLATLDTVQSMRSSRRFELLPILYSEWASRAPEEALKSAAQQSKYTQLRAVSAIVSNLPVPVSSDFLELSESLAIDQLVNQALTEVAARELMQTSPQTAFEMIFSDNVDDVEQESLLSDVIGTWLLEPDDEEFSLLFSSFLGEYSKIDRANSRAYRFILNLLEQIVEVDPRRLWQLNLKNPSDSQYRINFHLTRMWGRLDPQAALEALAEIEGTEYYEESYDSVWTQWAATEPMHVLQNIQQVQPKFRESVIGVAVLNLVRQDNVEQARASIVQMKDQGENIGSSVRYLTNAWVLFDAPAVTDWLLETDTINDALRKDMLNDVLPILSNSNPQRAFELAVEYGEPVPFDPRFTLEMRVMGSIAKRGDFEIAKRLLETVDDTMKVSAYSIIAQSLVDFGRIDEVISLGEELAEVDQTQYFENLARGWFQIRPDELFENLANLPTVESQQAVARLLLDDRFKGEMSQDEISMLEYLVSELETP